MEISELYIQLPSDDLERLIAHPEEADSYVFPPGEDNDVNNPNPLRLHIEEYWHVLHFLITRTPPQKTLKPPRTLFAKLLRPILLPQKPVKKLDARLEPLVSPKQLGFIDSATTQLTPRYLTAPQVDQIGQGLKELPPAALLKRLELRELIEEGIYKVKWWKSLQENPNAPPLGLESTMEGIGEEYENFVDFFERTRKVSNAMLIVGLM